MNYIPKHIMDKLCKKCREKIERELLIYETEECIEEGKRLFMLK